MSQPSNESGAGNGASSDAGAELNAALAALEDLAVSTAKSFGKGAQEDLEKYAAAMLKDTKRAIGRPELQKELRAQMDLLEERYRVRFENTARGLFAGALDIVEKLGQAMLKIGVPVLGKVL